MNLSKNNLNIVRFIAAGMVLYSHSYSLLGLREPLFLSWMPLGPLGVFIFFIISGYLISESWDRDAHFSRFFYRRLLRIIPGLVICTLLTVFILGPLLTTLSLKDYFTNPHTRGYFQNIILHIVYYLPGVFEHNRIPNAVNGSLWSLPVEFIMYIILALVGVLHGNRWCIASLAIISAIVSLLWAQVSQEMLVFYNFDLRQAFLCGTYFWIGACIHKFELKKNLTLSAGMLALIIMLCLEPWTKYLSMASWVLLPIVVLSFGFAYSPWLNRLSNNGDYSYGVYIYAFPVQQTIVYLWPNINIGAYMIICFVITLLLAILSWHLVEKRALLLKPRNPKTQII